MKLEARRLFEIIKNRRQDKLKRKRNSRNTNLQHRIDEQWKVESERIKRRCNGAIWYIPIRNVQEKQRILIQYKQQY